MNLFPAGAGSENFAFEAIPDVNLPDLNLRLCRIRMFRIGEALPCIQFSDPKSKEIYSKSVENKTYDDYGRIDIPVVCPVNYPRAKAGANKVTAQVVYELTPESGVAALSLIHI